MAYVSVDEETPTTTITHGGTDLTVHVSDATDKLVCPCGKCQRQFDSEMGLKSHMGQVHHRYATRTERCPECSETFTVWHGRSQTYCSPECVHQHKRDWWQTERFLREQYLELGKSMAKIAFEIDVGTSSVRRALIRCEIPRR